MSKVGAFIWFISLALLAATWELILLSGEPRIIPIRLEIVWISTWVMGVAGGLIIHWRCKHSLELIMWTGILFLVYIITNLSGIYLVGTLDM